MNVDIDYSSDDEISAGAIPDLLRPEVLDAFDRETFERDGYWGVGRSGHRCRLQTVEGKSKETATDERRHSHGYRLGCN